MRNRLTTVLYCALLFLAGFTPELAAQPGDTTTNETTTVKIGPIVQPPCCIEQQTVRQRQGESVNHCRVPAL